MQTTIETEFVLSLPRKAKPHLCTPKATSRRSTDGMVYAMPIDGRPCWVATDVQALVAIPAHRDTPTSDETREVAASLAESPVVLERSALDELAKEARSRDALLAVGAREVESFDPKCAMLARRCEGTAPDVQGILDGVRGHNDVLDVCLDAERLAKIAKAMATTGVRIRVVLDGKGEQAGVAMRIEPIGIGKGDAPAPDSFGLLMPISDNRINWDGEEVAG